MPIQYIFKSNDASIKTIKENTGNGWIIEFRLGIPISISTEYIDGDQLNGIEMYTVYKYTDSQYYNITCGIAINDDFTKFQRLQNQIIIIWYIPF